MTMSFASLPVIPELRLTSLGVIDVNTQTLID
jgi:adenine deaminase